MSYEYLTADQKVAFDAWLRTASADDRHECACSWNWDQQNTPLRWLIEQPDCEQATALWIFWHAEPTYYAEKYPNRMAAMAGPISHLHAYDLASEILKRWRAGVYRNDTIQFIPGEVGASIADVHRFSDHSEMSIPEAMVMPVGRRQATPSEQFDEGIPFSILGVTGG